MKTKTLVFIIALVTSTVGVAFGQDEIVRIQGKVIDKTTRLPLAHASIFIRNKPVGTVSNEAGEFEFKVPVAYRNDSLTISFIGYEDYRAVVSKVQTEVFELNPSAVTLPEIEFKELSANSIIRQAVDHIDSNYPTAPYMIKAFYRDWKTAETFKPDSSHASLIEAAVTIFDRGYKNNNNKTLKEDVFLDEVRRTKAAGTIYNYLDLLLKQNYVRHNKSKNIGGLPSFFDASDVLTYELEGIVKYGDGNAYLITGALPSRLGSYEIYINETDYAFVAINFKGKMSGDSVLAKEPMPWNKKRNELIYVNNTLRFRKFGNVYFPSYTKLNWRTRTIAEESGSLTENKEFYLELMVNEIINEDAQSKRAQLKSPMSSKTSLEQQIRPYNEAFWKNYNIVKENPLDPKLVRKLQQDGSMDDQFKNQKADPQKKKKKSRGPKDPDDGDDNEDQQ